MPVVFKKDEFDDAYVTVSDYLTEYFYKTDRFFGDLIVFLSTDNGVTIDRELAFLDQDVTYCFENDWYEGGDVILYGFTRVNDAFMLNKFKELDSVVLGKYYSQYPPDHWPCANGEKKEKSNE